MMKNEQSKRHYFRRVYRHFIGMGFSLRMGTMKVYKAINAVQSELAILGITKNRRTGQGNGYSFRGIDDVYNAIAPLLSKHGLCILPRVLSRECLERMSKSGGGLFYVTVDAEFDFVSAEDGSKHTVKTFGEAMDSGDKATNKAMSAAYKYACFQAFSIPTEADNDADAHTHELQKSEPNAAKIINMIDMIENSANKEELQRAYTEAYALCSGNQDWQAKVVAARNARIQKAKEAVK